MVITFRDEDETAQKKKRMNKIIVMLNPTNKLTGGLLRMSSAKGEPSGFGAGNPPSTCPESPIKFKFIKIFPYISQYLPS